MKRLDGRGTDLQRRQPLLLPKPCSLLTGQEPERWRALLRKRLLLLRWWAGPEMLPQRRTALRKRGALLLQPGLGAASLLLRSQPR